MHSHLLDESLHHAFITEQRVDPVTREILKPGDEIVLCASCQSAFLVTSWTTVLDGSHCGQSNTLMNLPTRAPITFSARPGQTTTINNHNESISLFTTLVTIAATILLIYSLALYSELKSSTKQNDRLQTELDSQRMEMVSAKFEIVELNKKNEQLLSDNNTLHSQIFANDKHVNSMRSITFKGPMEITEFNIYTHPINNNAINTGTTFYHDSTHYIYFQFKAHPLEEYSGKIIVKYKNPSNNFYRNESGSESIYEFPVSFLFTPRLYNGGLGNKTWTFPRGDHKIIIMWLGTGHIKWTTLAEATFTIK